MVIPSAAMDGVENLGQSMVKLLQSTGFAQSVDSTPFPFANYIMLVVAFVLFYLAIARGFEPLLLVPIAFGVMLANIPGAYEELS